MLQKTLLKAIKPFRIASLLATYALGAGLVQYVRHLQGWGRVIQGGLFLIFIVLSIEYLRLIQKLQEVKNWPKDASLNEIKRTRWVLALLAATFLTISGTIFVDWMIGGVLWPGLIFLLLAFLFSVLFYYLSDLRKTLCPFRILFEVLTFVVFPPAFAYFLHSTEPHRLLTMVVVSLVPAYLAYRLLIQLKSYRHDVQYEILTYVTTIGWEKAMIFHNALILMVYFIFALTAILGFPWFLLWPVFLTFPIGLVEIWLMERVRRGGKPLWRLMQFATACVLYISIYLLGFAFWIR